MTLITLILALFFTPEPILCTGSVVNLFPESNFAFSLTFLYTGAETLEDVQFFIQPAGFYRLTYVTDTGRQITLIPDMGAEITLEPNTHATLYYEGGIALPAKSLTLQSGGRQFECDLTHAYFEKVYSWLADFFRMAD
ncbi:MAG: hypothetical protein K8I82_03300 [Anaerolineae bacterium]|nr:hypothetical protein [Anaerolineae bacterium]